MRNKIIGRIVFGIFIGIDIGLLMSILFSYLSGNKIYQPAPDRFLQLFSNEITAMIASVFIWASIGALFSVTSLIFTHTEFSISKITVLHCIINYILSKKLSLKDIKRFSDTRYKVSFTVIYIFVYFIVWIVFMLINKRYISEINAKLNK